MHARKLQFKFDTLADVLSDFICFNNEGLNVSLDLHDDVLLLLFLLLVGLLSDSESLSLLELLLLGGGTTFHLSLLELELTVALFDLPLLLLNPLSVLLVHLVTLDNSVG